LTEILFAKNKKMIIKVLFFVCIFVNLTNAGCLLEHDSEICSIKSKSLYDFGPAAGDESLPRLDDSFIFIKTQSNFKFYDNYYSAFFLSTNGFIELIKTYEPFKIHGKFNFVSVKFPVDDHAIIAPFWSDHIPEANGQVFYRATNQDTLDHISYDVDAHRASCLRSSFLPTWALIVTWYQLKAVSHRRHPYSNTFQLVLASDGEESYVLFNYGGIEWPNKNVNASVTVGYNLGDKKNFFEIKRSPAVNFLDLQNGSNVGMKSRWMYRVDNGKHENNEPKRKNGDTKLLYLIVFLTIFFGIISIFNTAMWLRKLLKQNMSFSDLQMAYKKQVDDL